MGPANTGNTVKVDYIGMLDGRVVVTSIKSYAKETGVYERGLDYEPLLFSIGDGKVIKGFEDALLGMYAGEEKTVAIPPHNAYGNHRPDLVRKYPRALFEHTGIKLEPGMVLKINTSKGALRGVVKVLDENDAVLDLNHEFAGKHLIFKIIMREIVK